MKIVVAADPVAVKLIESVKQHLITHGHDVVDVGASEGNDVPFFEAAKKAVSVLQGGKADRGILSCGNGMGMAIVAGKHKGMIAACVESVYAARLCRSINNANILCLGAMIWGTTMANEAVDVFLTTEHTEGLPQFASFLRDAQKEVEAIDTKTRK